jgi:hypothetical protein
MSKSYLSPKCELRQSLIHGQGIFARDLIKKDEIYAVKGGSILTGESLKRCDKELLPSFLQIEEDFFIGAISKEEYHLSMIGFNHSCNPNAGFRGNVICVAMRNIQVGEEITYDYATFITKDYLSFKCSCGFSECRNVITGEDWKKKELQEKYEGYFSLYIENKII